MPSQHITSGWTPQPHTQSHPFRLPSLWCLHPENPSTSEREGPTFPPPPPRRRLPLHPSPLSFSSLRLRPTGRPAGTSALRWWWPATSWWRTPPPSGPPGWGCSATGSEPGPAEMPFAGLREPWRRKPPRLEVCVRTLDGTRLVGRIRSVFSVKREGEGEEPPRPQLPAHFLSVLFSLFLSFSRVRYLPPPRPSLPSILSPCAADVRSRGGWVSPPPCILLRLCFFLSVFFLLSSFRCLPLVSRPPALLKHTAVSIPLDLIKALEVPSHFTVSFAKRKPEGWKWLLHLCLAALAKTIHPSPWIDFCFCSGFFSSYPSQPIGWRCCEAYPGYQSSGGRI